MNSFSAADTAWLLTATCLVLMMTVPGIALFYGGMVRKENVLSCMMQSFAACCLVTIVWMVAGYSLAFSPGGGFLGDASSFMLAGSGKDSLHGSVPELLFMVFQMAFAIITAAVICSAFAERMKFRALFVFLGAWSLVVYAPIVHWVWGGGFLQQWGVLDFAGGSVVELSSGIAGLTAALMLGPRRGFPHRIMRPHNLTITMAGAGLLWVGWLGFNGGSALGANSTAALALTNTQAAGAAGAVGWIMVEWMHHRHPTALGIASGAVAGLVAITPACGYVSPLSALVIGLAAGALCFYACRLKHQFGYDDELDAFGIHGMGGLVGMIALGFLASSRWGGKTGFIDGNTAQPLIQLVATLSVAAWSALGSFAILRVIDQVIGLRIEDDPDAEGMDARRMGETVP